MSPRATPVVSMPEQIALALVALAVVAMLSFPAARGFSETLGWLPFWLLTLPLSAWAVARLRRRGEVPQQARAAAKVYRLAATRNARAQHAGVPQALRRAA